MKNVLDILHLHSHSEGGCARPIGHPHRDWRLLSIFGGALFLLGALFDGWMYVSVLQDIHVSQNVPPYSAGPSAQDLTQALAHFSTLQTEHAALLSKAPTMVVDPAKAR